MRLYLRSPVGIRWPRLSGAVIVMVALIATLGSPVLALALLVWSLAQIMIQVKRLVDARAERRAEVAGALDVLIHEGVVALTAAAVHPSQYAELAHLYAIGIPAYKEFRTSSSLKAWTRWTAARDAIASVRAWKFGPCPNCGVQEQRRAKPCTYCRKRVA